MIEPKEFNYIDINGNMISIGNYLGKYVLLDFWGVSCHKCFLSIPTINYLYDRYHDKGFEVIGICLTPDSDLAKKLISKFNITWPNILANSWKDQILQTYNIKYTPRMMLLNPDGHVIINNMNKDDLMKVINYL